MKLLTVNSEVSVIPDLIGNLYIWIPAGVYPDEYRDGDDICMITGSNEK